MSIVAKEFSEKQLEIIETIEKVVGKQLDSVFYTPEEWAARGEEYGTKSALVVTHDGGDHASYFNFDYMRYKSIDKMMEALAAIGYYAEQCTCWYSAIYKI
jgi:hypothetical protein